MLADGMNNTIVNRKIDRFRVLDDVLHVFLRDFALGRNDRMHAVIAIRSAMRRSERWGPSGLMAKCGGITAGRDDCFAV